MEIIFFALAPLISAVEIDRQEKASVHAFPLRGRWVAACGEPDEVSLKQQTLASAKR